MRIQSLLLAVSLALAGPPVAFGQDGPARERHAAVDRATVLELVQHPGFIELVARANGMTTGRFYNQAAPDQIRMIEAYLARNGIPEQFRETGTSPADAALLADRDLVSRVAFANNVSVGRFLNQSRPDQLEMIRAYLAAQGGRAAQPSR